MSVDHSPKQNQATAKTDKKPIAVSMEHWLSFDVEEYFQVEAASHCVHRDAWADMPRRLPASMDRILALLDYHDVKATFFVLGWVARNESEVVRRIAAAGHEIASHGNDHQMLTHKNPATFREDLRSSLHLLEDISGRAVLGYRAPTFTVTDKTAWAIDVLAEEGFRYDSSVFPIHHDRYGVAGAPPHPHVAIGPGGGRILELPPLTVRAMGLNWPVGGGGYFRLLPRVAISAALAGAQKKGHRCMVYLHPWEFDPAQPDVGMARLSRWRHRVNLDQTADKLANLLQRFAFSPVENSLSRLTTGVKATYEYGRE